MAVRKKGMRKVNYKGRQYLWYVQDKDRHIPEEGGLVEAVNERWLHVIGSKKQLIIHYRIPEPRDEFALLKIEGPQFPRRPGAKEIKMPRWKHDSKRYPTADFVRRLIHWCMETENSNLREDPVIASITSETSRRLRRGMSIGEPTPYDDVNAILAELLTAVSPILGDQFIGLYLTGSLASGDFNPRRSDIDFIIATADGLPDETVTALAAMHARLRANGAFWATRLEGDYIPLAALRRHDPAQARYPHLGDDGHFAIEGHDNSMIVQFHILRKKGGALAGPPPHTLVDPISPDALREAMGGMLAAWEQRDMTHPERRAPDYQVYAVLTMCRILYTLRFGAVVSKPAAAKWAIGVVDGRFTPLIEQANAWQNGMPFDKLAETVDFIGYTLTNTLPEVSSGDKLDQNNRRED